VLPLVLAILLPVADPFILETENFSIRHKDPALAAETAKTLELERKRVHAFWFGETPKTWTPKCEVVLHPSLRDLDKGGMPGSPAFSQTDAWGGKIHVRRMEFAVDSPDFQPALPHELVHICVADGFTRRPPRWADEGMAVMTEPEEIQQRHLEVLAAGRRAGRGYSCREVMSAAYYPSRVPLFYGTSVGLCRMLVAQGGRPKFVAFLRDAMDVNDYDSALERVYKIRGIADLETRFQEYVRGLSPVVYSQTSAPGTNLQAASASSSPGG
jgi:hypothetical protein